MVGAGRFKNFTSEHPEDMGIYLNVIPLRGTITMEDARSYLEGVTGLGGVGIGAATRLLSMKRPDLFLPANNASQDKICAVFGRRADTIDKYLGVVNEIWSYPWFAAPAPNDTTEHRIWRARVALLDAIFYEPV